MYGRVDVAIVDIERVNVVKMCTYILNRSAELMLGVIQTWKVVCVTHVSFVKGEGHKVNQLGSMGPELVKTSLMDTQGFIRNGRETMISEIGQLYVYLYQGQDKINSDQLRSRLAIYTV